MTIMIVVITLFVYNVTNVVSFMRWLGHFVRVRSRVVGDSPGEWVSAWCRLLDASIVV